MLPQIPEHYGIPNPVCEGYVEQYVPYVMTDEKQDDEDYCYDEKTEILTDEGWKYFCNLNKNEKVATLNPDTGEIIYQYPDDYIEFDYSGDVFLYEGRYINFCVNKGHSLFAKGSDAFIKNNNGMMLDTVDNLYDNKYLKFKCDGSWVGSHREKIKIDGLDYNNYRYKELNNTDLLLDANKWLFILGVWIAEGSIRKYKDKKSYNIVITLNNKEDREYIKEKLRELNINPCSYKKDIVFSDKRIWNYLYQFGLSDEKFIPNDIKFFSKENLQNLYEGMMFGDGDKRGYRYTTKSKKLADDFSEVCFKIGKVAKVQFDSYQSKTGFKNNGCYRVHIRDKYNYPCVKNNIKKIDYIGKLYCVKVPKYHILYIRRDGIPHWSGNTYGERLCKVFSYTNGLNEIFVSQINHFIELLKKTPNTNQAIMQIGDRTDIFLEDPPCLRHIDMRIKNNTLIFYPYFRSWDLWGAFPANLAGITVLQKYMADEIGVKSGEIIASSKGLHIYKYVEELVKLRTNKK